MSARHDRESVAAALSQTIYALAISVSEPHGFKSADARSRAALMLVDAFDLVGEATWNAPSDAERHPSNAKPPFVPVTGPVDIEAHVADARQALRAAAAPTESEPA